MSVALTLLSIVLLAARHAAGHVAIEPNSIMEAMNAVRARVSDGSNLRKLEWNLELAELAQSHSDKCTLSENIGRETDSFLTSEIGECIDYRAGVVNSHTYVRNVISEWESLGDLYEFDTNVLSDLEASKYTQLVWATTSQVGCGVSECKMNNKEYHYLVCNFQPGGNGYGERPYVLGVPCSGCPQGSVCSDNLCTAEPETESGSEPHFGVELASKNMLCFSVHGQAGSSMNLVSTSEFEVNAIFTSESAHGQIHEDSLGAVEVLKGGRRVVINVTSSKVCIDPDVKLDFKQVQKISLVGDQLSLTMLDDMMIPSNQVEVMVDDLKLDFFITNHHLDMIVSNKGQSRHFDGLFGEFLHPDVSIDETEKTLSLPDHNEDVTLERRPLSTFIHAHSSNYETTDCWTAIKEVDETVEGVYFDHDVGNILSASTFTFGTAE